jgi:hypothetical protein
MNTPDHTRYTSHNYIGLHFIDGSGSHNSYAAVARRGNIFLGIRFSGLTDGHQLGVPGKTYLHARMRSARDQALAEKLDLESGADNVIGLFAQQLALDEAWPGLTFEKVDVERASLHMGMFIDGSLTDDTDAVIARIEQAGLLRKLVDYAIVGAGLGYRIARTKAFATWLSSQAKPALDGLKKAAVHHKIAVAAQKEFAEIVEGKHEIVATHAQQLNAIYQKHKQASLTTPE